MLLLRNVRHALDGFILWGPRAVAAGDDRFRTAAVFCILLVHKKDPLPARLRKRSRPPKHVAVTRAMKKNSRDHGLE